MIPAQLAQIIVFPTKKENSNQGSNITEAETTDNTRTKTPARPMPGAR
jgi:hypothetical protein